MRREPDALARVGGGGASQRGLLNDFTRALGQQMFYWGRDVLTGGNLLLAAGFEKRPSPGLQGTSCYRLPWRSGFIELHGACAGWYPADAAAPGFLFVRADRRCYAHRLRDAAVPGRYDYPSLRASGRALPEVMAGARCFAAWLHGYEVWVERQRGAEYRKQCREMLGKLEAGRVWLPPGAAQAWLRGFAKGAPGLPRANRF
jgi:hypothetical protein